MTKEFWAFFIYLLACGPPEGSTVFAPPSIAVTCAPFGIAYRARIVSFLVAHGERDGASVTDRHKSQSSQDGSNWYNIQNLQLHASFVNNFWVVFIQPSCNKNTIGKISTQTTNTYNK
jgi:hypothetical protein